MTMTWTSPIPQLGLGTWGRAGDAGTAAILKAIEFGYRHLDTAQHRGPDIVESNLQKGDRVGAHAQSYDVPCRRPSQFEAAIRRACGQDDP